MLFLASTFESLVTIIQTSQSTKWTNKRWNKFGVVCLHVFAVCLHNLFSLRLVNFGVEKRVCILSS